MFNLQAESLLGCCICRIPIMVFLIIRIIRDTLIPPPVEPDIAPIYIKSKISPCDRECALMISLVIKPGGNIRCHLK